MWKCRQLTIKEKITILRSQALPIILYPASVLFTPEHIIDKIDKLFFNATAERIADRTEFYVALTAMIMGVQFFLAGFIAEMMGRTSAHRNVYLVERTIDVD